MITIARANSLYSLTNNPLYVEIRRSSFSSQHINDETYLIAWIEEGLSDIKYYNYEFLNGIWNFFELRPILECYLEYLTLPNMNYEAAKRYGHALWSYRYLLSGAYPYYKLCIVIYLPKLCTLFKNIFKHKYLKGRKRI